jgi:ubiquinone/menaquinone biosynthesis C-methylase UbiE
VARGAVRRVLDDLADLNRVRKARRVLEHMRAHDLWSVLTVGTGWRGLTEVVIGSVTDQVVYSDLSQRMNKRPYVCADGLALPFRDGAFDLVFSNAVIEHVGDERDQQRFVDEHRRVARHCVLTTPNRWFPVESHTRAVLRHWSPRWRTGRRDVFTRLLSRAELARLLPPSARIEGRWWSPTFLAVVPGRVAGRPPDGS